MDFNEYLKDIKLTDESIAELHKNGIISKESFTLLSEELIQKYFGKKLSLGQILLLSNAVENTQATVKPALDKALTAEDIVELTSTDTGMHIINSLPTGMVTSKAKQISDHLTLKQATASSPNVTIGDFELKLREGSKTKLEQITQAQYLEGSMRILLDFIYNGMTLPEVTQHAEYLLKVGTFAQGFAWTSVMQYDSEFRRLQKEKSRPWNVDDNYLMQLHLRNRPPMQERTTLPVTRSVAKPSTRGNKFNPSTGTPICEKYNGKNGCNFTNCRYAHVCMLCYDKNHNEFNHKTDQKKGL